MIDYGSCDPACPVYNMTKAFWVAEEKLGIIRLLDPEDVAKDPDEKKDQTIKQEPSSARKSLTLPIGGGRNFMLSFPGQKPFSSVK